MSKPWSLFAVFLFAGPLVVVAQDDATEHSQHEQHAPPAESTGGERAMAAMHEHMRSMQEQMARIHATEDPAERERLMREHMQSMQQHMRMMGSMHGAQHAAGSSRCADGDTPCRMDEMRAANGMMQQRMRMMEGRLDSMQQLMLQMMERERVDGAQDAEDAP